MYYYQGSGDLNSGSQLVQQVLLSKPSPQPETTFFKEIPVIELHRVTPKFLLVIGTQTAFEEGDNRALSAVKSGRGAGGLKQWGC